MPACVLGVGRPADGLVCLDVAVADHGQLGGFVPEPVLLAVSRADTPSDTALGRALPHAERLVRPAGRVARIAAPGAGPWRS